MKRCATLFAVVLVICPGARAVGQDSLRSGSPLERILNSEWDAERSGPMIAVDPGHTLSCAQEITRRNAYRPLYRELPQLAKDAGMAETLRYFGRQITRAGGLNVLAPTEMAVLNTRLGEPNIYAGLDHASVLRLFEASLTRAQWQRIGGTDGLGIGDLTSEQRAMYLALLPDPFVVRKGRVTGAELRAGQERIELSPEQRAAVRLRMNRLATYSFPQESRSTSWVVFNQGRLRRDGEEMLVLEQGFEFRRPSAYGAELILYQPNKLKSGDLNFDSASLNRAVLLRQAENPLKMVTVGELVKRTAAATGVKLYCDPRPGALPVWTAGESVRAGDLLKGLCLAVTGTFRKVGPAFVLTDDVKGIGARRCLIGEWLEDAARREAAVLKAAEDALSAGKPEQYLEFSPGVDLPVHAERLARLSPGWSRRVTDNDSEEVAMSDLSPAWQARLRDEATRGNEMGQAHPGEEFPRVRTDRVKISVSANLSYLIPGLGAVEEGVSLGRSMSTQYRSPRTASRTPTPEKPPLVPGVKLLDGADAPGAAPPLSLRALSATARTPAEAKQLAEAAKSHGFTHLWLEVPEGSEPGVLAAATAACRERGLALMPSVRLLFKAVGDGQSGAGEGADTNILGESDSAYQHRRRGLATIDSIPDQQRERFVPAGDWLRIDSPDARERAIRRVADMVDTPGIAGLVVRDTAAPGYLDSGNNAWAVTREGWDFGYSATYRLAFLRQEGADPIDLPGVSYGPFADRTDLPFFRDDGLRPQYSFSGAEATRVPGQTVIQRWSGFRHERNTDFMADLYRQIRSRSPKLPLIAEARWQVGPRNSGRYGVWEKAAEPPDVSLRDTNSDTARSFRMIQSVDHLAWSLAPASGASETNSVDVRRKDDPKEFAVAALRYLSNWRGPTLEGFVIDFSELSADRAIEYVRALPILQSK